MDAQRMADRRVTYEQRIQGTLYNYQLSFNKINSKKTGIGYANILSKAGSKVKGALYSITPEAIQILDGYEGYPSHYGRERIFVHTQEFGVVEAWVYIAQLDKTADGLIPENEYLKHLLAGQDLWDDDNLFSCEIRIAAFGNPVIMEEIPEIEKHPPLAVWVNGEKATIHTYLDTWSVRLRIDFEVSAPISSGTFIESKNFKINKPGWLETDNGFFGIQHRLDR
jgi:gamma-glutamylcyclotransferase (GGCT)/AIG2-like uncharacterized protein YtfP